MRAYRIEEAAVLGHEAPGEGGIYPPTGGLQLPPRPLVSAEGVPLEMRGVDIHETGSHFGADEVVGVDEDVPSRLDHPVALVARLEDGHIPLGVGQDKIRLLLPIRLADLR